MATHLKKLALILSTLSLTLVSGCIGGSSADDEFHPGIGVPRLSISAAQSELFDEAYLGGSQTKDLNVCNQGNGTATNLSAIALSSPYDFEGGSFPGTTGTCGTDLHPGDCCTIALEFSPEDENSHQTAVEISYYNGPGSAAKTVSTNVTGTAIRATSGTFDSQTFGTNGTGSSLILAQNGLRGWTDSQLQAIEIQADGKILTVGYSDNGTDHDIVLTRFLKNGSIDTGFGNNGTVRLPCGPGDDLGTVVKFQPDGKILVAGVVQVSVSPSTTTPRSSV